MSKLKKIPLMTKILYIITLLIFILWVIPTVNAYFSNTSKYEESKQELQNISTKYGLSMNTQKFTKEAFNKQVEPLFTSVDVEQVNSKTHEIKIAMKQEDLETFHTLLETLALKYYVEIQNSLSFSTQEDDSIQAKFTLKSL